MLAKLFDYLSKAGIAGDIGDDAAVIVRGGRMAVSVDSYSEGVHFNSLVPDDSIGYRTVTGAVSDIAAMGSAAGHVLISMGLPRRVSDKNFFGLYGGIKKACRKWHLKVSGGDIVASRNLYISVTAIGPAGKNIRRSSAQAGDILFITSYPGLSSAGLARLSDVSVNIESALVPLKKELLDFCGSRKKALKMALEGGEDYYLVGSSPPEKFAKIKTPVFRIGMVEEGKGVFLDGNRTDYKGFRHFA